MEKGFIAAKPQGRVGAASYPSDGRNPGGAVTTVRRLVQFGRYRGVHPGYLEGVIVEFVGVHGVGKSTAARAAAAAVRARGVDACSVKLTGYRAFDGTPWSKRRRQADRIVSLARQPALLLAVLSCLARDGRGEALGWLVNLARRSQGVRRLHGKPGVAMLEEGPLAAMCIAAAASNRLVIKRIAGRVCLPDLAVSLTATPTIVAERLRSTRPQWSGQDDGSVAEALSGYRDALDRMIEVLPVPVLSFDTGRLPAAMIAESVADAVSS